jgi:hypothetical protein
MAAVAPGPDGAGRVDDEVVVLCTRAALEAAAVPSEGRRRPSFHVPRRHLRAAVPAIDPSDFEDRVSDEAKKHRRPGRGPSIEPQDAPPGPGSGGH